MKLSQVLEELVQERGLNREVLTSIICEGLHAAYSKKHPGMMLSVEYDRKNGDLTVFALKKVVSQVENEELEITVRKARVLKTDAQIGDEMLVPFESPIGRIEVLRAKQVIAQKIRAIEAKALYEEFKSKEGTIVTGTIYKTEIRGIMVKLGEALAFLPKSLMIPGDICTPGYTIKALLKEVLEEPRNDNQLILDRKGAEFVAELFRLEIPEIYENVVEIKKIARIAGYKSKIIVISHDSDVDPIGTCIGFGGARIKPILRELGTEKIDLINETFSSEDGVRAALKPAVVRHIEVTNGEAEVWLDADQRSLAIGKMGQNIALASELCGLPIRLMEDSQTTAALPASSDKHVGDDLGSGVNETEDNEA